MFKFKKGDILVHKNTLEWSLDNHSVEVLGVHEGMGHSDPFYYIRWHGETSMETIPVYNIETHYDLHPTVSKNPHLAKTLIDLRTEVNFLYNKLMKDQDFHSVTQIDALVQKVTDNLEAIISNSYNEEDDRFHTEDSISK